MSHAVATVIRTHKQLTKRAYQVFRTRGLPTVMFRRGRRAGGCPEIWVLVSEAPDVDGYRDLGQDRYRQVDVPSVEGCELRAQCEHYHGYPFTRNAWRRLGVVGTPKDNGGPAY